MTITPAGKLLPVAAALCLSACSQAPSNHSQNADTFSEGNTAKVVEVIESFDEKSFQHTVKFKNIDTQAVSVGGGEQALALSIKSQENYKASMTITPETAWNWQQHGDFHIALDIKNPTSRSTHLFTQITDGKKQLHNRSVIIPANSENTYYIELAGDDLNLETGIRSNPPAWQSDATPFIWRWGVKTLDTSDIRKISFGIQSLLHDRELVIDNLRIIKNPATDSNYLANLVDEFGQRKDLEFDQKVHSTEELLAQKDQELAELSYELPEDRSRFGGWKQGPKLKATGYFRTEKIGEQWALVDPDGYLFFSHGIANVRMANTSTITGVDFPQSFIKQREAGDLTPEDSLGLNRAPKAAWSEAFVASDVRRNMFSWLPEYDDPLAKHYGYRRSVHTGAIDHGETYSFYQANLERKYGDDFIDTWRDVTVQRMISWGFTSFGNWIDPMFYQLDQFPYFANGWIIGDFKTVSSGNDYWSALPDPFDPVFRERARVTVTTIAEEVLQTPWCIGVFIDNEKSWGQMGSDASQYGIVIGTLQRDGQESPTKAQFTQAMKAKYGTIKQLNQAWGTDVASWQAFDKGVKDDDFNDNQLADYALMLELYASEYFRIVKDELKQVLPNHLYMGARFADWGMTPEIVAAAAKHVDVMSYNFYKEGLHSTHWEFLDDVDMPSIIGEFHIGATDSGLLNPGLVHAENQQDRADMYTDYMNSVLAQPHFVGAHWFQYTDSPLTGRAYDGENYNVGFVSATDIPYTPLINAVKAFNADVYPRKFGDAVAD